MECRWADGSLIEALEGVADPRHARGVRYRQSSVLALCVVAFVCGAQNLSQIRRFGQAHSKWLREDLGLARGCPSVQTLSRLLRGISPGELSRALCGWLGRMVEQLRAKGRGGVVAVDGKTSRGGKAHVLSFFARDLGHVVWQVEVADKANEITACKEALSEFFAAYPFLSILTGDAMFAGAPLCGMILAEGRDYHFQVKADQHELYRKLGMVFRARLSRAPREEKLTGEKKRRLRHRL